MDWNQLRFAMKRLCAYKDLEAIPLMVDFAELLKCVVEISTGGYDYDGEGDMESDLMMESGSVPWNWAVESILDAYGAVFFQLRQGNYKGFGDFFNEYLRYEKTLYGTLVAEGRSDPALENAARREIETLITISKLDCDVILEEIAPHISEEYRGILGDLPRWSTQCPFDFDSLTEFYQTKGCGIFAKHQLFSWRGGKLIPVTRESGIAPEHMYGYELQRNQVLSNTRNLVAGIKAQNILLFGDGGTGKSAVVKSMAHIEEFSNLRLIQAENDSLGNLPELIGMLEHSPYRFIIFIDDLAFDQDDNTYSALKSILEGGLESPPSHVVVYATSNRRHLVRQNFSDRGEDEVDARETISEKTALAERFGLRIPYLSMNMSEYLDLVDFLLHEELQARGLMMKESKEDLHRAAMMWEIRHGGRTPRVAHQYILSLFTQG